MTRMKFDEFVDINPRITLKKGEEYSYVEMADIESGNRYAYSRASRRFKGGGAQFVDKDVLFARITPCLENGKIAQYRTTSARPAFGSTEFLVFRGKEGVAVTDFVFYLCLTDIIRQPAEKSMSGASGRQRASLDAIKEIELDLPSLPIQRRIAAVLSAYDDLIENNTQRIKALEAAAQALYREWFVEFRFPGHESVEWVESELGRIPKGWEVCQVAEVAEVFRGRSYRSEDLAEQGGLPFLNLKCIERDGGFRHDGLKRYTGKYQETHKAQPGDIIMAVTDMTQERRIVARAALVPEMGEAIFVYSMDLVKIVPFKDIPSEYLYGMFRFSHFPDQVKQHANGANVLHLSPDRITEFTFALPPLNLRTKYSSTCADLYRQSDTLHRKNALLREARDLLLPRLISGELSVENVPLPEELDYSGG